MPVAKLRGSSTPDAMKSEEGNDSLDTYVRQAVGKEPFLSFSRTGDSPVQWIQLLHALDQQADLPGWPLLSPLKIQMQKCDKCSREFCSPINYRRHIRVHRRSLNVDKESHKSRDLLGAFWDKVNIFPVAMSFPYKCDAHIFGFIQLSLDEVKEVMSFKDVTLEEVPGSSIIKSLTSLIRKPGFCTLPQLYLKAGSALLDIIQSRPSRLPVSSHELFSILDDASERTFLCAGTAESMQKYVFDGEAGKIGLEMKNLIACTSFLVEQKLRDEILLKLLEQFDIFTHRINALESRPSQRKVMNNQRMKSKKDLIDESKRVGGVPQLKKVCTQNSTCSKEGQDENQTKVKDGQIFKDEKALIEDSKEPQQSLVIVREETQVRSNESVGYAGELKQPAKSKNSMPLQVDVFLPHSNVTPMESSIECLHTHCKQQATPNVSLRGVEVDSKESDAHCGEVSEVVEDSTTDLEVEEVLEMVAGEMKETVASLEFDVPFQMRKFLRQSSSTVAKEFPIELHLVDQVNSSDHGKPKGPPTVDVIKKEVNVKLQEGNVTTREMGPTIDFVIPDKFKDPHVESKASLQAELLERKRLRKLRQKEQKVKEQANGEKVDLKDITDDVLDSPPSAEISSPSVESESSSNALEITAEHVPSPFEPVQTWSAEEDEDAEAQFGFSHEHLDSGTFPNAERRTVHGNGRRSKWQMPKSQRFGRNGFYSTQNPQVLKLEHMQKHATPGDPRAAPIVSGNKVWTRKPKTENEGKNLKSILLTEDVAQTDQHKNSEVMIGSISVTLGNCTAQQQGDDLIEAQEHAISKPTKTDSVQGGTQSTVKLWRPVSRHEARGPMPAQNGFAESKEDVIAGGKCNNDRMVPSETCLRSCASGENGADSHPLVDGSAHSEGSLFSSNAAKAFLAQRWKEAIAADHVKLVLSAESEPPGCPDNGNDGEVVKTSSDHRRSILGNAENVVANVGPFESKATDAVKAKFRIKPEKGVTIKYIPKQRAVT
ncbi:hypothetical protein RHGRI_008529 [Rhododendron griersonianum]|uniref:C2H2-type domain-containing protein n=1 Tax=Rhododendron griersonianum TaxID=479676 RepID=A0AAV6L301_9ERIC|nr:hypothetical protein RHGRI_008529 [Rhododendron griersonianum]